MNHGKVLADIYFNPKHPAAFGSQAQLLKAAKKIDPNISIKDIRHFWASHRTTAKHAEAKYKGIRQPVAEPSPFVTLCGDLAFFNLTQFPKRKNNNCTCLCVVVCAKTRMICGLNPQKNKSGEQTANSLQEIFSRYPSCNYFMTDMGKEFLNSNCQRVYKKFGIKHYTAQDPSVKISIVERCILKIKRILYKMLEVSSEPQNWVDKLADVSQLINQKYNRGIGFSPLEATKPSNSYKVWQTSVGDKVLKNMGKLLKRKKYYKFKIGDICRILKSKNVFKSSSYEGRFSTVLYKIIEREIKHGLPIYTLAEALSGEPVKGTFYEWELRKMAINEGELPKIHKVLGSKIDRGVELVKIKYDSDSRPQWVPYTKLIEKVDKP